LADKLIVIPQVSESLLLAGWAQRATAEGACVIRKKIDRQEIIAAALAALDNPPQEGVAGAERSGAPVAAPGAPLRSAPATPPQIDAELAADFLALGYAYLQEELLTRQMRYMSQLDQSHFDNQVVAGAQAAAAGDLEKAREHLQACFDVLTEAREHVYPAEAYLVDLTLVAPSTLGTPLRQQLADLAPTNLLITGETLAAIAAKEPETLAALASAVERETVSLVGGELSETDLPLLPLEQVLANIRKARQVYREHLGRGVEIFGRRRAGLSPILPQLLARSGFSGALHFTLDDGQFPRAEQSKSSWEGVDSTTIDILGRVPLDAERPESFLKLCRTVGEAMDHDFVATVTFARWPGKSSPGYDDLRRLSRYAPVLGKFVTLGEYFRVTASPGQVSRFSPDQYQTPYLKQAIIRRQENPLSRVADAQQGEAIANSRSALITFAALLRTRGKDGAAPTVAQAASEFAAALPRETSARQEGCLIVNPLSFPRRVVFNLAESSRPPEVEGAVKAVQSDGRKLAVVEVPALGYAWVAAGTKSRGTRTASAKEPPLGEPEQLLLRNEFFELLVDRHTGAIRALHDYRHRGNRLSQQIALRQPGHRAKPGEAWRDPDETAEYSVMAADSVEVTSMGPVLGEIVSRGRLVDPHGQRLAAFRQTVQVGRGSRVIELEIELEIDQEPRADPWNSYYAARFAWPDEAADLYRGVSMLRQPTDAKRLEAPYFIESKTERQRLAILTGGLPYHRRVGLRMLDTLLVVRGEKRRKFRLGLAVDHPQPLHAAMELLCPVIAVAEQNAPPRGAASSWLFHLEARNVFATRWEPLCSDGDQVVGFRVRLLENEGRAVKSRLRCFRRPMSAKQVNFAGETLAELAVDEDSVSIDFAAFEWVEVEVRW
jgi:alpha-mannosidase